MSLSRRRFLVTASATGGMVALHPFSARAQAGEGWELCNRTSYIIQAAVGLTQATGVSVDGWTRPVKKK